MLPHELGVSTTWGFHSFGFILGAPDAYTWTLEADSNSHKARILNPQEPTLPDTALAHRTREIIARMPLRTC